MHKGPQPRCPGQRHCPLHQAKEQDAKGSVDAREEGNDPFARGFAQVQLSHEGKGEWREESHRRRRESISDAKGAKGVLAVFPS